ncbi:unnamed protein product [Rotaria sordida]|uniref:Uncharacterized protein n=1 Tax=Rotaria sordida TaxID=392033 RepID=A0A813NXG5_9BILA|nr:unnamed protein product [Rotaria sordida]CAF0899490.1 unnamed protein product [Rotaria sordida]
MAATIRNSDNVYSNGSTSNNFKIIHDWFTSFEDEKVSSTLNHNPKLNAKIHLAITEEPSNYVSSICDHLFSLYHNVQHRLFVLQFLPSFVITYYDVLYHHRHLESIDTTTKDVCSTIDTFLVGLYNLSVTDDGNNEKTYEFRVPNLTLPSIYHTPNPDHYAPIPLTQYAISKHEQKCEVIRLQSFSPFDSVNGNTREQILWFLLIQYGTNVSFMDKYSRRSYIKMSKKLLGQGFSFNGDQSSKTKSILPPTGRRIHVASRIMSEMLGTLFYFKFNASEKEADECMRLLKLRAEYEMYPDVILMTESMKYLHEFETQQPEQHDTMGIEIELPPTMDIVRQKRTATTRRSIKNRQRSNKQNDTTVLSETNINENINIIPATPPPLSELNMVDENSLTVEYKTFHDHYDDDQSSPIIDEARSNISSSIGPATSTPSPSSTRFYKPVSLTSTQTYFNNIQQQQPSDSSPTLQLKTKKHNDDTEPITMSTLPYSSNIKHREKKDATTTVRFNDGKSHGNETNIEETYL